MATLPPPSSSCSSSTTPPFFNTTTKNIYQTTEERKAVCLSSSLVISPSTLCHSVFAGPRGFGFLTTSSIKLDSHSIRALLCSNPISSLPLPTHRLSRSPPLLDTGSFSHPSPYFALPFPDLILAWPCNIQERETQKKRKGGRERKEGKEGGRSNLLFSLLRQVQYGVYEDCHFVQPAQVNLRQRRATNPVLPT